VFQVGICAAKMRHGKAQRLKGLEVESVATDQLAVRHDWRCMVGRRRGGSFSHGYTIAIYSMVGDRADVGTMRGCWRTSQMIERGLAIRSGALIGHLNLLAPEERIQMLEEWNDTRHPIPKAMLPDLFEATVKRTRKR